MIQIANLRDSAIARNAYEAGADAMLAALKNEGVCIENDTLVVKDLSKK